MTKRLQCDVTTVNDTQALFYAIIESFPDTTNRLTLSTNIVHCPPFQKANVKLDVENESALSRDKIEALSILKFEEKRAGRGTDAVFSFRQLYRRGKNLLRSTRWKDICILYFSYRNETFVRGIFYDRILNIKE